MNKPAENEGESVPESVTMIDRIASVAVGAVDNLKGRLGVGCRLVWPKMMRPPQEAAFSSLSGHLKPFRLGSRRPPLSSPASRTQLGENRIYLFEGLQCCLK